MSDAALRFLGIPLKKPKVAFFDFTSCEGCQLQIVNNEATLLDFLALVDVVAFREAMTEASEDYEIAFIEGSITREDEAARLREIREKAKVLIALGSCAAFGGVNRLRDRFGDLEGVKRSVYGQFPIESGPVRAVREVVAVDLTILGCPVRKEEVERVVMDVILGKAVSAPRYPVCMECKARENICMFDLGEPCIGPITRAGCGAWCPSGRCGCWGCRGPCDEPNMDLMHRTLLEHGFTAEAALDRIECFGGFQAYADSLRLRLQGPEQGSR